jgi:hypothetical protein
MILRLHILIAKVVALNIQDVSNGLVGTVAVHVQDMGQRGDSAGITVCTCWFPETKY